MVLRKEARLNRAGPSQGPDRRRFLSKSWLLIQLAVVAVLGYPFFQFLKYKAPSQPRRVVVPKLLRPGGFLQEYDFVIFEGEKGPWAVSRQCTHLGCKLNFLEKEGQLVCPCHQSRFSLTGKRLAGPARKDLPVFSVERVSEEEGLGYIVIL